MSVTLLYIHNPIYFKINTSIIILNNKFRKKSTKLKSQSILKIIAIVNSSYLIKTDIRIMTILLSIKMKIMKCIMVKYSPEYTYANIM